METIRRHIARALLSLAYKIGGIKSPDKPTSKPMRRVDPYRARQFDPEVKSQVLDRILVPACAFLATAILVLVLWGG